MQVRAGRRAGWVLALLLGACGGAVLDAPPPAPPQPLEDFAKAAVVFGQPVFVFNDSNQGLPDPSAATLTTPGMPSADPLCLPDTDNNRVLVFHQPPILNNLSANSVLGQAGPRFAFPGVGAAAMRAPTCACLQDGRLYVSDSGNHRVLVWNGVPEESGAPADLVLGQFSMTGRGSQSGPSGMNDPAGISAHGPVLVVADRGNHRVLLWRALPDHDGAPCDVVLGQRDPGSFLPNGDGAPGPATLLDPCGVWTDGERLVVADRGNHRVLVWRHVPRVDGTPADLVLGQPDFADSRPRGGRVGLDAPCGVASDGTRLFVADAGNHRVLVWDRFPDASQAPPDRVLGQSDFDHNVPNDDDQDGVEDAGPSARTLKALDGLVLTVGLAGDRLYVGDAGNHRLLVFHGV